MVKQGQMFQINRTKAAKLAQDLGLSVSFNAINSGIDISGRHYTWLEAAYEIFPEIRNLTQEEQEQYNNHYESYLCPKG